MPSESRCFSVCHSGPATEHHDPSFTFSLTQHTQGCWRAQPRGAVWKQQGQPLCPRPPLGPSPHCPLASTLPGHPHPGSPPQGPSSCLQPLVLSVVTVCQWPPTVSVPAARQSAVSSGPQPRTRLAWRRCQYLCRIYSPQRLCPASSLSRALSLCCLGPSVPIPLAPACLCCSDPALSCRSLRPLTSLSQALSPSCFQPPTRPIAKGSGQLSARVPLTCGRCGLTHARPVTSHPPSLSQVPGRGGAMPRLALGNSECLQRGLKDAQSLKPSLSSHVTWQLPRFVGGTETRLGLLAQLSMG